jgi:glycosyltransferase involved in cell wall biosynthesis
VSQKLRVAFVIQRYGEHVVGGAEQGCRQLAELMVSDWDVTVITTCAKNYLTWENELPRGESNLNGVKIIRYPVAKTRNFEEFSAKANQLEHASHRLSADEEAQRFIDQGPYTPELVDSLSEHYKNFDAFIFYTYLYYTTAAGLPKVADKAYLISTAHDEPPFYFVRTYAPMFHSLRGIIYLSESEKDLINRVYQIPDHIKQIPLGLGIPFHEKITEEEIEKFNEKYKQELSDSHCTLLYLGRIAPAKGCRELISQIQEIYDHYGVKIRLLLGGANEIEIPDHPSITYLGFLSEKAKVYLLERVSALVNPSHLESFSIVIMEAWKCGTPVVVNRGSLVMKEHCDRSSGGLYYSGPTMLAGIAEWLIADPAEAKKMGMLGRHYVKDMFNLEKIKQQLLQNIGVD